MLKALRVELMKLQWWLVGCIVVAGPTLAVMLGVDPGKSPGANPWETAFGLAAMRYAWIFYPLLAGILSALICREDHLNGGWKLILSLPVSRTSVYVAKFTVVAMALACANLVFGAAFLVAGRLASLHGAVPFATIGRALLAGWLAVLPLAAVQMWVSSRWKSFGAALALNVCLTLPAVFAAQSHDIGPWYPWAQPMLAMVPMMSKSAGSTALNVSPATLWIVIVGGFLVAMTGGLVTFARADVRG